MKPRWSENLVLVCDKCGKKIADSAGGPNPTGELKDWLKKELITRSLWGTSRVVVSSCLDICPENQVAVAYLSDRADFPAYAETIDPVNERERVLQTVIARAKA